MIKKNKKSKTARPIHNHDTSQSPPVYTKSETKKKEKKKVVSVFVVFCFFYSYMYES